MWRSLDIKVMALDRHKNGSTRIVNSTRLMIVFLLRVMVLNKQILPYYKLQIIVFTVPATVLSMLMLSFSFSYVVFLSGRNLCLILCLFVHWRLRSKYQEVAISLTYSTPPHGCDCPDLNFQRHISRLFICSVS